MVTATPTILSLLCTPPTKVDLGLGLLFLLIDTATYVCAYHILIHSSDADPTQAHVSFILYGYIQSLIGFAAGLWLARITEQPVLERPLFADETITLIEKN